DEIPRIEQVMTNAPVPATFKTSEEFMRFVSFNLEFPGYGESSMAGKGDDGSTLLFEAVEIPRRDEDRLLVARESSGQLQLVDDFVFKTATNEIDSLKLEKQTLRYFDSKSRLLREKDL